jgi:putative ABC transport system substrate-binding protein
VSEPLGLSFVATLARPGGNLTGVSAQDPELAAKRLELLIMTVPGTKRVAVLWDPRLPSGRPALEQTERAAQSLNLELVPFEVEGPDDFEPALRAMLEQHAGALIVMGGPFFSDHEQRVTDLITKARLPGMFFTARAVRAGGLISYGPNWADTYRRAAVYVDKILKGAKPADLPVEQPTKFELAINLKTAKQLDLTIPSLILASADEVIE